jgi:Ca-activated chloride channel family protein
MLRMKQFSIISILVLMVALLATACAPSKAEKLNKEGNDAFTQQAFQEALVAYQTAQIEEPELAEPYYNAANALYRQGAYADALKQMEMALGFADKEMLAQAGYYNLGNSFYNQQDLQTAVDSYRESLLLNPDDEDAKYNLELALQQLQQQQQNEEEQQDQSEEEQQEEEQQDQSEEGQQDEEQQGEEQQDQSEEGQGDEEQQDSSEEGQQEEEQQSDSEEGQESDQGQEGQEQSQEEEQQQDGEQGEQQEDQQQPGEGQPQDGEPQEDQPGQLNEMPQPGQRMTAEQAEQLLAAIARDGQTLQEKLGQIFAVPWTPPVQDW